MKKMIALTFNNGRAEDDPELSGMRVNAEGDSVAFCCFDKWKGEAHSLDVDESIQLRNWLTLYLDRLGYG